MPMLNTNGCRQAGACEGAERGAARQGCKSVCHARRRGCHAARVWLGTCKPAEALAPPPHAHLAAVAAAVKLAAIGEGACSAHGCGQPALSSRGCCQQAAGPLGSSRLAAAQNGDRASLRASLQYMPLRTAAEPGHDRQGGRAPWCGWPTGLTRVVHGHAVALLGAGAAALLDDLLLQARLQQGGRRAAAAALGYPSRATCMLARWGRIHKPGQTCAETDEKKQRRAVWARLGRWASSAVTAAARWGATRGACAARRGAAAAREHSVREPTMATTRGEIGGVWSPERPMADAIAAMVRV